MLRATMDISARAISLTDRPRPAIWVTSVRMRREDRTSISSHPLADLGGECVSIGYVIANSSFGAVATSLAWQSRRLGRSVIDLVCFEAAAMGQDGPGDAGELVGERDRQNVAVQTLLGCLDPGLEPVALPALRLDQHNPCRLHEQNAQVAIAPFRYLAEDGAVAGRDLLGDESQP